MYFTFVETSDKLQQRRLRSRPEMRKSSLSKYVPEDRKRLFLQFNGGEAAVALKLGQMQDSLEAAIIQEFFLEGKPIKAIAHTHARSIRYIEKIKYRAQARFKVLPDT